MAAAPGTTTSTTKTETTKTGGIDKSTQKAASTKAAQDARNYAAWMKKMTPTTRGQDMQMFKLLYPDYSGNILSDIQLGRNAQQRVQGILGPQIQNIADLYNRRDVSGTAAIKQLTDVYTNRVKDWSGQVKAGNDASYAQMAGLEGSLADFVSSRNQQLQGGTQAALANMGGAPQMAAASTAVNEAAGAQAAAGVKALGTSTLERMQMENAQLNSYAGMQPGWAAQEGIQQIGSFEGGLRAAMTDDLGDIKSKMPELVNQVYTTLLNNNNAQRTLKANRGQTLIGAMGDADTTRLNTNIAAATIAENIARLSGQSASDVLSAYTQGGTGTTTTTTTAPVDKSDSPGKRLAGAALNYRELLETPGRKSKFFENGQVSKYARYHPGLVRQQIERALRTRAGGDVPASLVTKYALQVMEDLLLPRTLPGPAEPNKIPDSADGTGGGFPGFDPSGIREGAMDWLGGIDWGNIGPRWP